MKEQLKELIEHSGEAAKRSGYLRFEEISMKGDDEATLNYILAKLALIVSEVGECIEAHRKNAVEFDEHCGAPYLNAQIELADVVIRALNLGYDIYGSSWFADCILAKMEANQNRTLEGEGKLI